MSIKNTIARIFSILLITALLLGAAPAPTARASLARRYVKPTSSGDNSCSSWANACILQTALTGAPGGTEIWVAAGTYKPTTSTSDRLATFQLKDGVAVYGGFAGTETALSQRNPASRVTILSGDIDNNDSQKPVITDVSTVSGNTTNSYHVVKGASGATLDGFTITAGYASGSTPPDGYGGGMFNLYGNPTLANLTFKGNSASYGGGMYNENSSPALTKLTFTGNEASTAGGGMYNAYSSNPTLTNAAFSGNTSGSGAGMYNSNSLPTLTNITFNGNKAVDTGGGIYNYSSSPVLKNGTFNGNTAKFGGGMFNKQLSNPVLTNVTFKGNSATNFGGGLYNQNSSAPQVRNTILWGNTAGTGPQIQENTTVTTVTYSVIEGACPTGSTCTHLITSDPKLGTLGSNGGFTQTVPLLAGSSAINAADAAICPSTDQRGVTRQGVCDIGAYEFISSSTKSVYLPLTVR
jgi:predicted outer membrane repeat protein